MDSKTVAEPILSEPILSVDSLTVSFNRLLGRPPSACVVPMKRALGVEPTEALRADG